MEIIAVHHHKGGVGKTTTVQSLAYLCSQRKINTLLIDCDGQGSLTNAFGIDQGTKGLTETLRNEMQREKHKPFATEITPSLHILTGGHSLFTVSEEISYYRGDRQGLLVDILRPLQLTYKLVLIDTPPNASWLVYNALFAADRIIAPVQCEAFAIDGIAGLSATLETLGKENKRQLKLSSLIPTFFDRRRKEHEQYLHALRDAYGSLVTKTVIRTDANLARAQTKIKTIFEIDKHSRGASDYENLAQELFQWRGEK